MGTTRYIFGTTGTSASKRRHTRDRLELGLRVTDSRPSLASFSSSERYYYTRWERTVYHGFGPRGHAAMHVRFLCIFKLRQAHVERYARQQALIVVGSHGTELVDLTSRVSGGGFVKETKSDIL
ncbi:hypothetical protein JTB14_019519 [Gonioctena quinquepunctata]|nr:hypothetical protein JTB14_019519 [Gonioctena quinquepunctata]